MPTDLYERTMAAEGPHRDLMRKVWSGTPWMVEAHTGNVESDRYREMAMWCGEKFGAEAWPIHGKPGRWQRGTATVFGWTWFGFSTEEEMDEFAARWGAGDQE